ncbi:hypothetical protein [Actinomadura sp. 7K507]|uniref:hypothetical protein n=1 Tax=Actinomadura sp. 7K507 TaxID=2530365 RepID=UPI001FB6E15E|nr:hypothetical protein [Actinomadura sp. 7K507]
MIAEAGSRAGTGGTSTSPAPSIPRLVDPLEPVPRVPPRDAVRPDPTVPRPLPAEPRDEPPDAEPGPLWPLCPLCPLGRDGPDEPGCLVVGGAGAGPGAAPAPAGVGGGT